MAPEVLIDNSAWARVRPGGISNARLRQISQMLADGRIGVCLPFILEAGYSARSAAGHSEMIADFMELPHFSIDVRVERRAVEAQSSLAWVGHHRLAPMDVMIAAVADVNGLGVLHYDSDYDVIAEQTDLRFDSVWLAKRGSL